MELVIFARFHAQPGQEATVETAIGEVIEPTRGEAGCLGIHAYRSLHDPQLFYINSRWRDETAFEQHVREAHTIRFVARVTRLIDHELDVARTTQIG
jgi:quinol monooxygenase YgiN